MMSFHLKYRYYSLMVNEYYNFATETTNTAGTNWQLHNRHSKEGAVYAILTETAVSSGFAVVHPTLVAINEHLSTSQTVSFKLCKQFDASINV